MHKARLIAMAMGAAALFGCGGKEAETPAPKSANSSGADAAATAGPATAPAKPASQTLAAGERPRAFQQCAVCHATTTEATPMIGPTLAGIYGAAAGQREDFVYSAAMKESGIVWDEATLNAFMENPQTTVRGNRMAYAGERNAEKRAEIIVYLKTLTPDGN